MTDSRHSYIQCDVHVHLANEGTLVAIKTGGLL
jgi:hypothetical protein